MEISLNYVKEVLSKYDLEVIGDIYKTKGHKHVNIKCTCGGIFTTRLLRAVRGERIRCRKCVSKSKIKSNDSFLKEIKDKNLVGYTFLEEYKGATTKIKVRHDSCGYEYEVTPDKFLQGRRCPKCTNSLVKDFNLAISKLKELNLDKEYEIIEMIEKGYKEKIKLKHLKCNGEFETTYHSFFNKRIKCPLCEKNSKGEMAIEKYLISKNIKYKTQYIFENLKYKKYLKFDFAIFNTNNELKCLIEYDGECHFYPIEKFGGEEGLSLYKIRDNIKTEYCKNNNLNLIRIPYTELDNIEKILNTTL